MGHIIPDSLCEICDNEIESTLHIFYSCHVARQMWALSQVPFSAIYHNTVTTLDWVRAVYAKVDEDQFKLFLICCWSLWYNRNQTQIGEKPFSPLEIANFAASFHKTFTDAVDKGTSLSFAEPIPKWCCPEVGFVKINFDAAVFANNKKIGVGVIARNSYGHCVAWNTHVVDGLLSPVVAEALAGKMAVVLARECQWRYIVLEGDCLTVIKELKQDGTNFAETGSFIDDTKQLVNYSQKVLFSHLKRACNQAAHFLARHALVLLEGNMDRSTVIDSALYFDSIE